MVERPVQSLPCLLVRLDQPDNHLIEALVDSGAEGNIMTREAAEQCKMKWEPRSFNTNSYSGHTVKIIGLAKTRVFIANSFISQAIYITEDPEVHAHLILGMPFVRSAKITFEHTDKEMRMVAIFGDVRISVQVCGELRR